METITRRIFCILRKLEYGSFLSASVGAMSIVVSPLGTNMDSGIQSSCWAPQQACSSCIFVNQKTDTRKGSKDKYSRDCGRDNSGLSCLLVMRLPTSTGNKSYNNTVIITIIKTYRTFRLFKFCVPTVQGEAGNTSKLLPLLTSR